MRTARYVHHQCLNSEDMSHVLRAEQGGRSAQGIDLPFYNHGQPVLEPPCQIQVVDGHYG